MSRVVIVAEGGYGGLDDLDYLKFIDVLIRQLTDTTPEFSHEPVLDVKVAVHTNEALEQLGGMGTIVFISGSMLGEAKRVKAQHPSVEVVLFTGLMPDNEVILIDKAWFLDGRALRRIIR